MKTVSLDEVLRVFDSHKTKIKQHIISGTGKIKDCEFNLLGTTESTYFGVDEALDMAAKVLELVQSNNPHPIVLLTDVLGQKLSARDEWLGMYAYFGHLLTCLHLARKNGNKIISLIYNQAIGGSFIAFGLMADRIFALDHAQLAVMWLEGMAKVTKIDIDVLKKLSASSPVFAPGVENFKRLGGLHEVLSLEEVPAALLNVLHEANLNLDGRAKLGQHFGGRTLAYSLIQAIENQ
jgi:malonate decarboxylase gamma subunit